MSSKKTICLNMIVKNESHVIEKTLDNLCSHIEFDYWVIVDTGSTDNTKDLITNYFKQKNIQGELHETDWQDFGFNRTDALNKAYNKTDYLFIFDADDKINGTLNLKKENLVADMYMMKFGVEFVYHRPLLVSNRKQSKFIGVLHEYFSFIDEKFTQEQYNGNYHIESGRVGNRNKDSNKYLKDAIILEKAHDDIIKNNPSDMLKIRYSFYCAQSYKDCNMMEKAIIWYKKRISYGGWNQEVYMSYDNIATYHVKNGNMELALYNWLLAYDSDPERKESILEVIRYYRNNKNYYLAYKYYMMQSDVINVDYNKKLFARANAYMYEIDLEFIIIASFVGKHAEAIPIYKKLFSYLFVDLTVASMILASFEFYVSYLNPLDREFYDAFMNFVTNYYKRAGHLDEVHIKVINSVIDIYRPLHTIYSKKRLPNPNNNNNVLLTITSCKRFDLFEKTMNSFINNCIDIHRISGFYCVDDNSSESDRKLMKDKYPFFEFYFKNESEKGHRNSMNIIWDKLNTTKPKYWLHMEDDWLFIKKDHYIGRCITQLEKYKNDNIRQVLFNKNYAEAIFNYNLHGGMLVDNNEYRVHVKDELLNGPNSAYWPHYSFRPSLIDTNTILELGNFDSNNTFFERDYADKYHAMNYKSMYFNEITCLHIGKCTWETNGKNAYTLNNEQQFTNKNKNVDVDFSNMIVNYKLKLLNFHNNNMKKTNMDTYIANISKHISNSEYIEIPDVETIRNNESYKLFIDMSDNIVSNALSHINTLIQIITAKDNSYYIVIEDDIHDKDIELDKLLPVLKSSLQTLDIIYLNSIENSFSYIVTKKGAIKILDHIMKHNVKDNIKNTVKSISDLEHLIVQKSTSS